MREVDCIGQDRIEDIGWGRSCVPSCSRNDRREIVCGVLRFLAGLNTGLGELAIGVWVVVQLFASALVNLVAAALDTSRPADELAAGFAVLHTSGPAVVASAVASAVGLADVAAAARLP